MITYNPYLVCPFQNAAVVEGVLAWQLDDAVFLRIAVQADGALLRWSLVRKGCDETAGGWVDDLGVSE